MIYVTGDTHIPHDIRKLNTKNFPEQKTLTKDDTVIICGDFGGIWNNSKSDEYWLKWLDEHSHTVCFCDGNHENFVLLNEYPIIEWNGGKVHQIKDSVFHLMRGEVYTIEGKTFFVLGGAESTDRPYRIEGVSWWSQEIPNKEEIEHARNNLNSVDWNVDYIITHTCSKYTANLLGKMRNNEENFQNFLDELYMRANYKHWYFGHFHADWQLDDKHTCVYNKIREIN